MSKTEKRKLNKVVCRKVWDCEARNVKGNDFENRC